MIVYQASKNQFITDVLQNEIEKKILTSFVRETGHRTGQREIDSWRNSMMYMNNIINDVEIPEDVEMVGQEIKEINLEQAKLRKNIDDNEQKIKDKIAVVWGE